MPGDTLHTQTAPTATGPGTLRPSPLYSGPIAMGNGSHPRDEHASTDGAQEGHGGHFGSKTCAVTGPDVFLPLGGQEGLLLSVGGELVSEKVETLSHAHTSHPGHAKGQTGLLLDSALGTPAQSCFLRDLSLNTSMQWPMRDHLAPNSWCKPL